MWRHLDMIKWEIRQALKTLRRSPGFVVIAGCTMAAGIGVNSSVFALVNAVLLQSLAIPGLDHLVAIASDRQQKGSAGQFLLTSDEREMLNVSSGPLAGLVMSDALVGAVSVGERSEVLFGEAVSGDYFEAMGLRPLLGRFLVPADDNQDSEAIVISERLWRRAFGGDSSVIGARASVAGRILTIVGVTSGAFKGTWLPAMRPSDFWVPLSRAVDLRTIQGPTDSLADAHRTFGRLKAGVEVSQADWALRSMGSHKSVGGKATFRAYPAYRAINFDEIVQPGRQIALAGMALAALVFAIACANLTNVLLARSLERRRDIAIRMAIGAGRIDIVRVVLAELSVVGGLAGIAAYGMAWVSTRVLKLVHLPSFGGMSIQVNVSPDARVLILGMVLAGIGIIVTGVAPALLALRASPVSTLGTTAGTTSTAPTVGARLRSALVAAQVMGSVILVLLAAACWKAVESSMSETPTFAAADAVIARVNLDLNRISEGDGQRTLERLRDAAKKIGGLRAVALATPFPGGGGAVRVGTFAVTAADVGDESGLASMGNANYVSSGPGGYRPVYVVKVSSGFFGTVGLSLVAGRDFGEGDDSSNTLVAIVSDELASSVWPGRSPLGRRVVVGISPNDTKTCEIVGVVASPPGSKLPMGTVYVALKQFYSPVVTIIGKAEGNASGILAAWTAALHASDPTVTVFDVGKLSGVVDPKVAPVRAASAAMGLLGLLALGIALLGVYGVMTFAVEQRRREVAIRRALGATSVEILKLMMLRGGKTLAVGLGAGLSIAMWLMPVLRSFVRNVEPYDYVTLLVVPATIASAGIAACLLAVWKGARSDANSALRDL